MPGKCIAVFTRGPNKGKTCGRACVGRKCAVHSEKCHEYRAITGASKKYDTLVTKTQEILNDYENVMNVLEKDKDLVDRKLYGIRLFLGDPGMIRNKHYNYIPFPDDTKQNALSKKVTLTKKRGTIVAEIDEVRQRMITLEKVKKVYNETNV